MTEHAKHFNARILVKFKNGNAKGQDVHTVHTGDDYLITTFEDITTKFNLSEIEEFHMHFH